MEYAEALNVFGLSQGGVMVKGGAGEVYLLLLLLSLPREVQGSRQFYRRAHMSMLAVHLHLQMEELRA